MPGVLILEAMAQVGGIMLLTALGESAAGQLAMFGAWTAPASVARSFPGIDASGRTDPAQPDRQGRAVTGGRTGRGGGRAMFALTDPERVDADEPAE